MESIQSKKIRVIKAGFFNDRCYTKGDCVNYLKLPIMDKTVNDIKFTKRCNKQVLLSYEIITKGKNFKLYSIDWGHTSQSLYVITADDKIIYYTFCSIFAPANSAWHTLTEVFFIGHNEDSNWMWGSLNDATCIRHFLGEASPIEFHKLDNVDSFVDKLYYHY